MDVSVGAGAALKKVCGQYYWKRDPNIGTGIVI